MEGPEQQPHPQEMDITDLAMYLDSLQPGETDPEAFEEASQWVKAKMAGLAQDQQLQLYGLYKQSTCGNVASKRPWAIYAVEAAKWDAWKTYEGFPVESARKAYVYIATQLLGDGSEPLEERDLSSDFVGGGMRNCVSTYREQSNDGSAWSEAVAEVFEAVVSGDLERVRGFVGGADGCAAGTHSSNLRDEDGMYLLHYAADRGHYEVTKLLLAHGARRDVCDAEGQTPRDYALLCEHQDIVDLLSKSD